MGVPDTLDGPWWKAGTLDPQRHYRMIQQRHAIAQRAGLGQAFMSAIWAPLPATVSKELRQWLINVIYRKPGQHVLLQGGHVAVAEVMRALVGALIRNEFDARLMTVEEIVQLVTEEEGVDADVLMVSDWALKQEPRTEVVKRRMMGVARQRINAGLPTVLFASDGKAAVDVYGPVVIEELKAHFSVETLGK